MPLTLYAESAIIEYRKSDAREENILPVTRIPVSSTERKDADMKRKMLLTAACLTAALLTLNACGNSSSVSESSAAVTTRDIKIPLGDIPSEPLEPYFYEKGGGISVAVPRGLTGGLTGALFVGETEHCSGAIFLNLFEGSYIYDAEDKNYTTEDVPEILKKLTIINLFQAVDGMEEETYRASVDHSEEIKVLGQRFLLNTGTVNFTKTNKEEVQLNFCGCYGITDIPRFNEVKVPVGWVMYTESDTEEAKEELREHVLYTAEHAEL